MLARRRCSTVSTMLRTHVSHAGTACRPVTIFCGLPMSYASVSPATVVETGGSMFAIPILADRCPLFRIADIRCAVKVPSRPFDSTLLYLEAFNPPTPMALVPFFGAFWRGLVSLSSGNRCGHRRCGLVAGTISRLVDTGSPGNGKDSRYRDSNAVRLSDARCCFRCTML